MADPVKDILKLSVEEKVHAIAVIWDSIGEDKVPVTDTEVTIAQERYQEYLKNPGDSIPWQQARTALMKKYGLED